MPPTKGSPKKAATPKHRITKRTMCGKCNDAYSKDKGVDWLRCDVCRRWFDLPCSGVVLETFVNLRSNPDSVWLCATCLPNLLNFLPDTVSLGAPAITHGSPVMDGLTSPGIFEDLSKKICEQIDKTLVDCKQSIVQHATNFRLLEKKLADSIEKVKVPVSRQDEHAWSADHGGTSRFANQNRLIVTNMPIAPAGSVVNHVLALATRIGVSLHPGDIDTCNQLTRPHPSNSAPIFVRFVSRLKRDEFYYRYLHHAAGGRLEVRDVFNHLPNDTRRIYVAEHLTPSNTVIYKEARFLRRKKLVSRVFTRCGAVFVVPLESDDEIALTTLDDILAIKKVPE
jgi:hypothetical protein